MKTADFSNKASADDRPRTDRGGLSFSLTPIAFVLDV